MMSTKITAAILAALCILAVNAGAAGFGAAALTNTQLRATPVPVSGPLTDAQLRATAVPVSGPVTDAQLRATAVPVSGPVTDAQLRATAVPINLQPQTSGGLSVYHKTAAAGANEEVIKASAGQVFGVSVINLSTTATKIVFYNTATTPTLGTTATKMAVVVPTGQSYVLMSNIGIEFSAGIAVATADIGGTAANFADTGSQGIAGQEVIFDVFYK